MKFSTSIEYAVHGLMYLAAAPADQPVLIGDVVSATRVPEAYLRKLFQQLVRSGLVVSQRGPNGGLKLARPPERISLKDVVESVDGSLPEYTCMKVVRGCDLAHPCPVHAAFADATRSMKEILQATTLRSVLDDIAGRDSLVDWLRVTANPSAASSA